MPSLFICILSVYSQETSNDQVMKKIEQLEKRVTILENIIETINFESQNKNMIPPEKQSSTNLKSIT